MNSIDAMRVFDAVINTELRGKPTWGLMAACQASPVGTAWATLDKDGTWRWVPDSRLTKLAKQVQRVYRVRVVEGK